MSGTQRSFMYEIPDLRGKLQKPQSVGDGGPAFAHRRTELPMRETELVDETLVSTSLVNRREGITLEILHERKRQDGLVVRLTHDDRDPFPSELLRRTPTTLAGYEFEPILFGRADDDGLEQARTVHRRRKLIELPWIKRMPRLAPLRQALREAGNYDELLSRLGIA